MKRLLAAWLLLSTASVALAFEPRTGHWWNPAESGRGFNVDIQENVLVVAFYSYNSDGSAQWYLASGPMTNDRHQFSGVAQKFVAGQCLACAYSGPPVAAGNDGNVSISFTSETSALVTLPGGRVTMIQPMNFAYGDPPQGLLGEWVYVEDILISFADRFRFTTIAPGTANDTGLALDLNKRAACAYQKSGIYAGLVWCLDLDNSGNVQNEYRYRFGLDETFGGVWQSQTTGSTYAMKGFRTASMRGSPRKAAPASADDPTAALKAAYDAPFTVQSTSAAVEAQRDAYADAIRHATNLR